MMHRTNYSVEQELERIYENLLPEDQLFIRRNAFKTLTALTQLATAYENARDRDLSRHALLVPHTDVHHGRRTQSLRLDFDPVVSESRKQRSTAVAHCIITGSPIDFAPAYRRCAEIGHFLPECTNPPIYFCWDCGRKDIKTIDCC